MPIDVKEPGAEAPASAPSLGDIYRQSYSDMDPTEFVKKYHQKFYGDMPFEDFAKRAGVKIDTPAAPPPPKERSFREGLGDFNRQVLQNVTFGLADEIASGIMTPLEMAKGAITGEDKGKGFFERIPAAYGRLVEADRKEMADYERDHPVASTAANIVGGVVTGGTLAKGGLTFIKPGATTGQAIVQGAKEGAAYGGLSGFGNAEGGLADRAEGAAKGAAVGGVIGGAIPAAVAGVKAVVSPVVNAARARMDPEGFAARKVSDRLAASGLDAETAANRLTRANAGGQSLALVDIGGEGARNLARTAANIPGPGQEKAVRAVTIRNLTQGDRIKRAVSDLLADPDAYLTTKDAIKEGMKTAAKPLYEAAEKVNVPFTNKLEEILQTPAGKAAMRDAMTMAANERKPFQQFFAQIGADPNDIKITRVPDMRAWDWIKRALDAKIEANTERMPFMAPRMNNEARILNGLKMELVGELDSLNPIYRQARQVWSSGMEADAAVEAGKGIFNVDPRQFARTMKAMSPQQQELARLGVAEALRDKIDSAGMTHNALLKFFSTRDQVNAIKAAFPDEVSFNSFRKAMLNEARMRKTANAVMGNSTTAKQLMDIMEARSPAEGVLTDAAFGAATGGAPGVIASLISSAKSGLNRLGGLTPATASKMVDMLFARDPTRVRAIVQKLQSIEAAQLSAEARNTAIRRMMTEELAMLSASGTSEKRPTP